METRKIKISKLVGHGLQPADRHDKADLEESIQNVGAVLVPPLVMAQADSDKFIVLDGHRRIAAARALDEKEIEVRVEQSVPLERQVRLITASNVQQPFTPWQHGNMLIALVRDEHVSFDDACQWMGVKTTDGRAMLRLLEAPEQVHKAMKSGELSFGTFRRELAAMSNDAMLEALNKGTTRKAVRKAKKAMAKEELPDRLLDDNTHVLAALTGARSGVIMAQNWLVSADTESAVAVRQAMDDIYALLADERASEDEPTKEV